MASRPEPQHYEIFLLGNTGVGKSASGNTLLGEKGFISKKSVKAVTERIQKKSVTFRGVTLDVCDTPGLLDPKTKEEKDRNELEDLLSRSSCPVILLVMKADGVSEEDKQVVDLVEDVIPERFFQNTWILFTRGDELERENLSIEEFIEDDDEVKELVQRFGNRYHVFNNFSESPEQVRMLIQKIRETPQIISAQSVGDPQTPADRLSRRIVLVGKTGAGKSATGNTILRKDLFKSVMGVSSGTSQSELQEKVVSGRKISVTDTPGLFDTKLNHEQLAEQIGRSIYLSRQGPHAFLYVQSLNVRFTEEEKNVVQKVELIFGEKMRKYTIIVFTFGDLLKDKSVDQFIEENSSLRHLVKQCGGRYHIMNNKQRRKQQVTELLEKIDRMVEENGGEHYSSELYEKAQRFKTFNEFFHACKTSLLLAASVGGAVGAGGGILTGAIIGGAVAGPPGAAIGAAIGAVVGLITGGGIGAGVHELKNKPKGQSAVHHEDEEDSESDHTETNSETLGLLQRSNPDLRQRPKSGRN